MLKLAQEWGKVEKALPRVSMLPGENKRTYVLSSEDEDRYLDAAKEFGQRVEQEYKQALVGIRATRRKQQPRKPDAFLLRDVTTILLDCALRPEECFRLRWTDIREGSIYIPHGKTENASRHSHDAARDSDDGNATNNRGNRLGFPSFDPRRSYREIELAEAALEGMSTRRSRCVPPLHVSAYLSNALGCSHGPVHLGVPGRA